jgi:EAL domain-containing protein (putative c-di-GMP-specific phosphodiesterase class I)
MLSGNRSADEDLLLILDQDPASIAALRCVADALGCDVLETNCAADLRELMKMRQPSMVVLSVDRCQGDDSEALEILAALRDRPATLVIGSVGARILASAGRAATARGLRVIGTAERPLEPNATERLLAPHLRLPPQFARGELEQALRQYELTLEYQPRVALREEFARITAVETLLRWSHPRRGVLHPRHFLNSFEEHGLTTRVTDYVVSEGLRQCGQWREGGLLTDIIVNVGPWLVRDRGFPDRLARLLRDGVVPPQQLVLAVPEAASGADRDLMLDVYTRLRLLGVGLCLDGFGTGISSLTDLSHMPFSEITVDHALIAGGAHDPAAQLSVHAIADMAHTLQLDLCAAGVATRSIYEYVRSVGFDTAQGKFFSAPLQASDVEQLLRSRPRSATRSSALWRVPSRLEATPT